MPGNGLSAENLAVWKRKKKTQKTNKPCSYETYSAVKGEK